MQLWQKIVLGAGAAIAGYWFFLKPKSSNAGPGPLPDLIGKSCGKWDGNPANSPIIDDLLGQTRLFDSFGKPVVPGLVLSPILIDGTLANVQMWLTEHGYPQIDSNALATGSGNNPQRQRNASLLLSTVGTSIEKGQTVLLVFAGLMSTRDSEAWQPGVPRSLFEDDFDLYTLSCKAG